MICHHGNSINFNVATKKARRGSVVSGVSLSLCVYGFFYSLSFSCKSGVEYYNKTRKKKHKSSDAINLHVLMNKWAFFSDQPFSSLGIHANDINSICLASGFI